MKRAMPRVANVSAKLALAALLVHAAAFSALPQYQHKGMGWRLALYPVALVLVPAVSSLRRRSPYAAGSYPHSLDLCVVLPFLLDTAGNAADLYDTVTWFDDVMHIATWIPLVTAFGLLLQPRQLGGVVTTGLTIGFGAVTHVAWEIAEYLTFVAESPTESASAYHDTIGDLAASLTGSILGAGLVTTLARRRRSAPTTTRTTGRERRIDRPPHSCNDGASPLGTTVRAWNAR